VCVCACVHARAHAFPAGNQIPVIHYGNKADYLPRMHYSEKVYQLMSSVILNKIQYNGGFGGLGVACWPLVPKFAGSNPAEAVGFLKGEKILSTPSFGGEVKPSVPCCRFAACKRSLNVAWKSTFRQNYRTTFSPTVPTSAAGISHVVADLVVKSGNV